MKKLFHFGISIILILVIACSMAGCMLSNNGIYYQSSTDNSNSSQSADANNRTITYNENVSIGKGVESTETAMSLVDAVEKVERTAVALFSESGSGSGVIVDMDNGEDNNYIYVITCFHMIEDKGEIEIIIPDENCSYGNEDYTFTGMIGAEIYTDKAITLVGGDKDSDIAVVKINLDLPATSGNVLTKEKIVMASIPSDNYSPKKGETVFAIGNPTGSLPGSVASGEISYLVRENQYISGVGNMDLMQISVTTNHGSSGGGLYNLYGELIGITNAGSDSYTAINYAIPCELPSGNGFVSIASQLLATATSTNYGHVVDRKEKYGFTSYQQVDSNNNYYVTITEIVSGSQAETQGLLVNDTINYVVLPDKTSVTICTVEELTAAIAQVNVGESFTINVTRRVGYMMQSKNITLTSKIYWFCDTGV